MSTPNTLTREQAEEQAETLLEQLELAKTTAAREAVRAEIDTIVLACSPATQDRLWDAVHAKEG